MEFSAATLGLGKVTLVFAFIILGLRFKLPMWTAIFLGTLVLVGVSDMSFYSWLLTIPSTATSSVFLGIACILYLIILLSSIQSVSGQTERFVKGVAERIVSPRLRLILFPMLIGLLPLPGGALLSCPMLDQTTKNMSVTEQKKTILNYWFRHIWEVSWPLYPGLLLACSLLHITPFQLVTFTFPLAFFSFIIGWFFFLPKNGDLVGATSCFEDSTARTPTLMVFIEALPLIIAIAGAALLSAVLSPLFPDWAPQVPFIIAVTLAVLTALWQGRKTIKNPSLKLLYPKAAPKLIILIFFIFLFKDSINSTDIISSIAIIGESSIGIIALFIIMPFVCGLLTGILVGIVGASFPFLLGALALSSLQSATVPLIVLALVSGTCGHLVSPMHICLVVTTNYFKTNLIQIIRNVGLAVLLQFCVGAFWAYCLYLAGAHF